MSANCKEKWLIFNTSYQGKIDLRRGTLGAVWSMKQVWSEQMIGLLRPNVALSRTKCASF